MTDKTPTTSARRYCEAVVATIAKVKDARDATLEARRRLEALCFQNNHLTHRETNLLKAQVSHRVGTLNACRDGLYQLFATAHGRAWQAAGTDAELLREIAQIQKPPGLYDNASFPGTAWAPRPEKPLEAALKRFVLANKLRVAVELASQAVWEADLARLGLADVDREGFNLTQLLPVCDSRFDPIALGARNIEHSARAAVFQLVPAEDLRAVQLVAKLLDWAEKFGDQWSSDEVLQTLLYNLPNC